MTVMQREIEEKRQERRESTVDEHLQKHLQNRFDPNSITETNIANVIELLAMVAYDWDRTVGRERTIAEYKQIAFEAIKRFKQNYREPIKKGNNLGKKYKNKALQNI